MITKTLLAAGALLIVAFLLYLAYLGKTSKTGSAPGLANGMLSQCPNKPNCVCSEFPQDTAHYIGPINFSGEPEQAISSLEKIITSSGGEIVSSQANYLAATFTSPLFGFVDDVEFRVDVDNQLIQTRSASRVGTSDLDANRKRINLIKAEFSPDGR